MQRRRAFSGLGECSRRAPARSRATGAALGTVSAARVAPSGFEPRTPASAAHFARLSKSRFICRLVPLASRPLESGARRGGHSQAGPPWSVRGGGTAGALSARGGPNLGPSRRRRRHGESKSGDNGAVTAARTTDRAGRPNDEAADTAHRKTEPQISAGALALSPTLALHSL